MQTPEGIQFPFDASEGRSTPILLKMWYVVSVSVSNEVQKNCISPRGEAHLSDLREQAQQGHIKLVKPTNYRYKIVEDGSCDW